MLFTYSLRLIPGSGADNRFPIGDAAVNNLPLDEGVRRGIWAQLFQRRGAGLREVVLKSWCGDPLAFGGKFQWSQE
jgi:hypothetical protein